MRVSRLLALAGLGLATAAAPSPVPSPAPTPFHVIITTKSRSEPSQRFVPTPPPDVLARTKYVYEAQLSNARAFLPLMAAAPEERYVKMYVTSVKRVLGVQVCRGWVVWVPIAGTAGSIVEEDATFACPAKMRPYAHGAAPNPQQTVPPT